MIKAVCFDLDGVYFTEAGFAAFKQNILEISDGKPNLDEIFHGEIMNEFKLGKIKEQEYWDYVNSALSLNKSINEYKELLVSNYEENEEVKELITKLRSIGIKTCICSNNFETRINGLNEKFNFLKNFDTVVTSNQIEFLKPSKEIFQALIDQSEVQPEEIVYSDDNESKLEGAKELGINVYLYDNFEGYKKYLQGLGVEI